MSQPENGITMLHKSLLSYTASFFKEGSEILSISQMVFI